MSVAITSGHAFTFNAIRDTNTVGFRFALLFLACLVVLSAFPFTKFRLRTYQTENFLQADAGILTTKEGRSISAAWEPKDPGRPDASCYVQRFAPPKLPPLHCSTGGYDPCPTAWECSLPFWSRSFTVYIGDTAYDILNKSADVLMPEMNSDTDTHFQQARAVQSSSPGLHQSLSTFSMESRAFHPYKNREHGRKLDFSYGYHHGVYTEQSTYFVSDPDVLYAQAIPFAARNQVWLAVSCIGNSAIKSRNEWVHEFEKLIPTHNYCEVGRSRAPDDSLMYEDRFSSAGPRAKVEVFRRYKFCIAYENAVEKGYMTEKLGDCLRAGSIPIYVGAPDVKDLWPLADKSMLVVNDFTSTEALAARVIEISSNETLFNSYLAWKDVPVPQSVMDVLFHGEGNVMCRACARHWDFQWKKLNRLVPEPDPLWWSSNSMNWKGP